MNAFFGHSTLIAYGARWWQISVKPEKLSPRILGLFSGKKLQNLSLFTFMLLGFYFHTLGVLSPRRGDETPPLWRQNATPWRFVATKRIFSGDRLRCKTERYRNDAAKGYEFSATLIWQIKRKS
ncbi:hypothetical protein [Alloprevotella sp. Lung230]|uniref:hypothetical protein n=1 Tax=Alloprevotella sp. Lung230 TaxID=2766595 RepID=UPI001654C38C|nr:hypothetical protein [Alloprevotella sp. Lung230]MBC8626644.1 hypothetical protein [Alloprevotella sp. Lung230]